VESRTEGVRDKKFKYFHLNILRTDEPSKPYFLKKLLFGSKDFAWGKMYYSFPRSAFCEEQLRTQEFFSGGGFLQIQLRTEGRYNGDLGTVAP
jgi:hypothetical protein